MDSDTISTILRTALTFMGAIIIAACLGLLLAFPIKWCWNHAVVPILGLPVITWGQAWCIHFVANRLIKHSNISSQAKNRTKK